MRKPADQSQCHADAFESSLFTIGAVVLQNESPRCAPQTPGPWRAQQQAQLKVGHVAEVEAGLVPYLEAPEAADALAPVRSCYRYLTNRPGQFEYQRALAADLPIGSGEIETAHRYVLQQRLKLAGAWWKEETAAAMLALHTLRANREWHQYWDPLEQLAA